MGIADDFVAAARAHPALRVASVGALEALAARLADHGVDVEWADPREIPGTTRLHLRDPWGNRLELVARDEVGTKP